MNGLRLALSLWTTLPLAAPQTPYEAHHWRVAALWFPFTGALVGGVVWLVAWCAQLLYPNLLAAILAVAAWVGITGGLHLDGLADCCDGLLAAAEPQQRLTIMRDPRLGAFGAIGLLLTLALKVGALQAVLSNERGLAVLVAAVLGRTSTLWLSRQPVARAGGMGARFARQVAPSAVLLATLPAVVGALLCGWRGGLALLATVLTSAGIARLARRRLGGMTGDVYGLTVELAELAVLLVFAAQFEM